MSASALKKRWKPDLTNPDDFCQGFFISPELSYHCFMQALRVFHISLFGLLCLVLPSQNIDSLEQLLKTNIHDTMRCIVLGKLIEFENDDNVWPAYNEEVMRISQKNLELYKPGSRIYQSFRQSIANCLNNSAFLSQGRGNITEAIAQYNESLKMNEEMGNKKEQANIINSLGIIFQNQGNIARAIECYHRSIMLQEETGDRQGLAYTLNNLGTIYKNQKEYDKAIETYNKGLKILIELNDLEGVGRQYNNLGVLYGDRGDYEHALEYYQKGLQKYKEVNFVKGMAGTYNNIGFIYYKQEKPEAAIENFEKSLKMREEIKDREGMAYTLANFGSVYFRKAQYDKSLDYAQRAFKIAQELSYPELIRRTSELLKRIYLKKNNYPKALEMFELYVKMRDSLNNLETRKASLKNQMQMDFEKAEAEVKAQAKAEKEKLELKAAEDKKRQNIIIYSVIAGLLLVSIFSLFIFRSLQANKRANKIISQQKREVEHQKELVEEKQKEILDSINYAKRIQYALLANEELVKKNLPEHFIFFRPKDIVSGDFYWAAEEGDAFYLAVCDSTGHGVPGGFMCILNIGFLSEAIKEKGIAEPDKIFNYVRERLVHSISRDGQKDGFDGILLRIKSENGNLKIDYAAANNAPALMNGADILSLEADKMPVGIGERKENFNMHRVSAEKGQMLYLYTDGFADQFGGPRGKKFKYKPLNELLKDNAHLSMEEQKQKLSEAFDAWKGSLEQVDDVCIIGIRV
jgi:tetratricopeptide (TPR) repeat protein